jgi:hypothetical protein
MELGKNSVTYMGLVLGTNKADNICGKIKVMGTMQRGSTVYASTTIFRHKYITKRTQLLHALVLP